jgi:hypothetical protein
MISWRTFRGLGKFGIADTTTEVEEVAERLLCYGLVSYLYILACRQGTYHETMIHALVSRKLCPVSQ